MTDNSGLGNYLFNIISQNPDFEVLEIYNLAAKRINLFLRWMVRSKSSGVDFGLWNKIKPSQLSIPLDIHSGNVSRKLGILKRKQNDNIAVMELDKKLRSFDPYDPVKYDFALFGLGAFERF